jgi:hypothetical protein
MKKAESPLFNGEIVVVGNGMRVVSTKPNKDGYYFVFPLVVGKYSITASAPGYKPQSTNANVKLHLVTAVNMKLSPSGK